MTDLEAACLLKELSDYNMSGRMSTPQGKGPDSIFQCAFDHAVRALEERAGRPDAKYARNPNGSYSLAEPETRDCPAAAAASACELVLDPDLPRSPGYGSRMAMCMLAIPDWRAYAALCRHWSAGTVLPRPGRPDDLPVASAYRPPEGAAAAGMEETALDFLREPSRVRFVLDAETDLDGTFDEDAVAKLAAIQIHVLDDIAYVADRDPRLESLPKDLADRVMSVRHAIDRARGS